MSDLIILSSLINAVIGLIVSDWMNEWMQNCIFLLLVAVAIH